MTKNNLRKITGLFFTSRVRIKIMKLFYSHPRQEFHMREISRLIDEQINAVRRELLSMEKTEFLLTRRYGIKKYFLLNPSFPFYNELRNITMKSLGIGHELYKGRKQLGNIKFAVLSHTYLNAEQSDKENIDLLIVGDPDFNELDTCIKSAGEAENKELFYTVMSEKDFEMRKRRRDALIYTLMVLPRAMIIGNDEEFVV